MNVPPYSNTVLATEDLPTVIAVNYELVRGSETQIMDDLLPRVKNESVALDLSGVGRIDAAGIAALITLYCSSVESGTDFSIVAPSSHVLELLRIVGLESILIAHCRPTTAAGSRQDRSAA
ncbi:STAS domain-containing protein [Acidicapsa ligni]|uniref:STAS domain-containing protein n=1 Tax=Acidicapsa ligni TaxID=542300 RepID=UPI0021E07E27|nr:STAS domain-containing protein [Acidicapsa ligni]